jgi:Cu/Ag efflux protein CusF
MGRWLSTTAAVAMASLLVSGVTFAQTKPADCKGRAPEKVEGQVVKVDSAGGKVTVRENDGSTHEFQASKETLQDLKPGDRIEAKLREAPKC